MDVRDAATTDLDPSTLYRILALRSEVFVVEQTCVYLDPDGRDLEPGARQFWVEDDGVVLATLRLLRDDPATARIGRVATAAAGRGQGLAARLMDRAIEQAGPVEIVLDAQTYLFDWYSRFGFRRSGPDFDEDGIMHAPMTRPAG
jgi:ElaA protein